MNDINSELQINILTNNIQLLFADISSQSSKTKESNIWSYLTP